MLSACLCANCLRNDDGRTLGSTILLGDPHLLRLHSGEPLARAVHRRNE